MDGRSLGYTNVCFMDFWLFEVTRQVENLRNINLRRVLIKVLVNQLKAILLNLKLIFIVEYTRVIMSHFIRNFAITKYYTLILKLLVQTTY